MLTLLERAGVPRRIARQQHRRSGGGLSMASIGVAALEARRQVSLGSCALARSRRAHALAAGSLPELRRSAETTARRRCARSRQARDVNERSRRRHDGVASGPRIRATSSSSTRCSRAVPIRTSRNDYGVTPICRGGRRGRLRDHRSACSRRAPTSSRRTPEGQTALMVVARTGHVDTARAAARARRRRQREASSGAVKRR